MKASGHIRQNPFEAMRALNHVTTVVDVAEVNSLASTAVEDNVAMFLAELIKRYFYIELVMLGDRTQHMKVIDVATIPASYGSFCQGQIVISDNQFWVEKLGDPQSIATGARACWVIEREHSGFQFSNRISAGWAGKAR